MGDYIDSELAKPQSNSDFEMQATRQAHYIEWCRLHDIDDPCSLEPGFEQVVAIYIQCVLYGVNYHNKQCVRSKTA